MFASSVGDIQETNSYYITVFGIALSFLAIQEKDRKLELEWSTTNLEDMKKWEIYVMNEEKNAIMRMYAKQNLARMISQ